MEYLVERIKHEVKIAMEDGLLNEEARKQDLQRQSKQAIGWHALQAARAAGWTISDKRLKLHVVIREPDRRIRDLNFSKNLKDGISESQAVWWDDCQVRDEHMLFDPERSTPSKTDAGATITITIL